MILPDVMGNKTVNFGGDERLITKRELTIPTFPTIEGGPSTGSLKLTFHSPEEFAVIKGFEGGPQRIPVNLTSKYPSLDGQRVYISSF